MSLSARNRRLLLVVLLLIVVGGGVGAYFLWFREASLPGPETEVYQEYLRAFRVGVAALDTKEQEALAEQKLARAVELIPGEPAGWANLGLLKLRKNDFAQATRALKRAKALAPESGEIEALLGYLAAQQGRFPDAVSHFRNAVEKDPQDLSTLFTLADTVHREHGEESEVEYQRLMEKILKVQPNNLYVLVRRAQSAYRRKDLAAFGATLKHLERLAEAWSAKPREILNEVRQAANDANDDPVAVLGQLDMVLQKEHGWQQDQRSVSPTLVFVGSPVQHFLRLRRARPTPAPPDPTLAFAVGPWVASPPVPGLAESRWDAVRVIWGIAEERIASLIQEGKNETGFSGMRIRPSKELKPAILVANGKEVRRADAAGPALPFPGGPKGVAPTAAGVLALDWNNDLRTDLLLAGAGGLRFYEQQPGGDFTFKDVTARTGPASPALPGASFVGYCADPLLSIQAKVGSAGLLTHYPKIGLPKEVLEGDYYGAWAADVDQDGDLDVIVARRSGPTLLLVNDGKGTFKLGQTFASVRDARAFVWADLDNDGLADAALLDAKGKLHVFVNERHGQFAPWPLPEGLGTFLALTAADVNDDGILDLVALRADGALIGLSYERRSRTWRVAELARWPGTKDVSPGAVSLFAADLDNSGSMDLLVTGPQASHIYLGDEQGKWTARADPVPLRVFAVLDLNADRRLDLLGLSPEGRLVWAENRGKKSYRGQLLWTVPNPTAEGDNRMNSFGIGGSAEVRAGALVQTQPIDGPVVHFGLGEQTAVDVVRIVWPNSVAQLEFELPNESLVAAHQRLHSSCPFLFTYDGTGMRFAGDFMWGTPLGMYVNGQNIGDFPQTTEWLKIPGEHLVPRDGYYDVRVQANLWEVDYFDQLALIVVDHPPDTEIYADERFFLTPTKPQLYVTTTARPVARAWDHHGKDATEEVRAIDGRYLDRAGRGKFQGVTRDHWVEADLGDDSPTEGPVYLIARGWLHPTNSSINVALAQGTHEAPRPLVLEVPDGNGGWKVGRPALGFPAGRNKTMLIRLDGIEGKGVSRRFRLRTNMEIYWDFLGFARGLDPKLARLHRPEPQSAELRYRGILETTQKDPGSPEIPHYDKVRRGGQPWRDLTGYHTRFGDVRELLAKVDDRYVIMNAGDEIALRFAVPPGPPPGWKRDFLWECDGWTRDGDLNTRFGNTVLPLPAHGMKTDDRPPGQLEDDPVYRRFPLDWQRFHTRYVTPDEFARGLRNFRRPR
jgi:cytochrome c-type biogenesis protein CcmH/NrfG